MLKDKAQPIVVDELLGRIDEVDENRKESSRYSLMLLLSETSSPERNLGYRRPAYFYLKLCDRFKKISSWRNMARRDCAGREIPRIRLFTLCESKSLRLCNQKLTADSCNPPMVRNEITD